MAKSTAKSSDTWKKELTRCIKGKSGYYGFAHKDVATIAGINPRTMSNRFNKPEAFTLEQISRLCKLLKITVTIDENGIKCAMSQNDE